MIKGDERYIQTLKPTLWIGKNGFSEEIAEELKHQLKARGVVKIKWLSNTEMDDSELAALSRLASAEVLAVRGKVVILGAKNRGKADAAPAGKEKAGSFASRRQEARLRSRKNQYWR